MQDLLYRTTATTNTSEAIVEAYDFDAYGNTLMFSAAGTAGNWWADNATATLQPMCEFLFTGRQYDPETEVYWYRSRYVNTALGRFTSTDTVLYADSENLFSFCMLNPLALIDPSGMTSDFASICSNSFPGSTPSRTPPDDPRDLTQSPVVVTAGNHLGRPAEFQEHKEVHVFFKDGGVGLNCTNYNEKLTGDLGASFSDPRKWTFGAALGFDANQVYVSYQPGTNTVKSPSRQIEVDADPCCQYCARLLLQTVGVETRVFVRRKARPGSSEKWKYYGDESGWSEEYYTGNVDFVICKICKP